MQYYSHHHTIKPEKYPINYCIINYYNIPSLNIHSLHLQGICKPADASLWLPLHTYSPHGGCNGKNAAAAQMQCLRSVAGLAGLAADPRATFSHSIRVAKILLAEPEAAAHICLSMWPRFPAAPRCQPPARRTLSFHVHVSGQML